MTNHPSCGYEGKLSRNQLKHRLNTLDITRTDYWTTRLCRHHTLQQLDNWPDHWIKLLVLALNELREDGMEYLLHKKQQKALQHLLKNE